MVQFDKDDDTAKKDAFKAMGKDVAMQVAAMSPSYLDEASVPAEVIEHEKEILTAQIVEEGKPEAIAQKIVMGRIGKFYKENCLVDQEFVKDNKMSIKQYVDSVAKELGAQIKVTGFVRYAKGEGLEKRQENFADEVKNQIGM